ncbi:MAG: tRNA lysidine(34) synthetase TilS [Planctomycetota bacterium]
MTHRSQALDPIVCLRQIAALALPANGRVLLAVSGGSDSIAMLGAAREVLDRDLVVVHVRHGLRADDERDARLVEGLCRDLALPCRVVRAPPGQKRSETAARRRRMQVLERVAVESGCTVVLCAHHADDARETVLLHLLRGHRGERALVGIPGVRRLGPECVLVRPFVRGPGREALADWRMASGLPCSVDPTNADTRILRNAVRAWLATQDPAFLARVDRVREAARGALHARVLGAAAALERGLGVEGLGVRVEREALDPPDSATDLRAHRSELLRLLGACLARPRRVDPRGALLDALQTALDAGRGQVRLPAWPTPLELHGSARAVHLPHEALDELPVSALVLRAVSAGSLHP